LVLQQYSIAYAIRTGCLKKLCTFRRLQNIVNTHTDLAKKRCYCLSHSSNL